MAEPKTGPNPLFLREAELREGIERLYFAYRDFIGEADAVLDELELGRAHHRVIYFVGRHPGISVSALLEILSITKQSLSRVLGELVARGYIEQVPGQDDRRRRCLTLTEQGRMLERQLTEAQMRLLARAYARAGAEAVDGFRAVLDGMSDRGPPRSRAAR